jgi:hypothetical protein
MIAISSGKQTRAGTNSTLIHTSPDSGIEKQTGTLGDLRRAVYGPGNGPSSILYVQHCGHRAYSTYSTVQHLIRAVRMHCPVLYCIIRGVLSMQGVNIPPLSPPRLHAHVSFCAAREPSRACLRVPTQGGPSRFRTAPTPCSGEPYSLRQRIMLVKCRAMLSAEEPESKSWEPS